MILEPHIRKQIIAAILATQGPDRVILEIEEYPCPLPRIRGARYFPVESYHVLEAEKCFHLDHVFMHQDRCIVLSTQDLRRYTLDTIEKSLQDVIV